MSTNISSIIDRIRKLQSLTKSSNAFEAANAAAAANKLIDQYRLSESELEADDHEDIIEDYSAIYESGRITKWKSILAANISKHYGCGIYNSKSYRSNVFKLVGRKSDIDIVHYMFAWLSSEITRLCMIDSKKKMFNKSDGKVFANSFCLGVVAGITEQLTKSRQEITNDANSNALVKLDDRYNESMNFLNKLHNLKQSTSFNNSNINKSAFDVGKSKGQNIHLGKGLNQANGVKLLGT